MRFSTQCIAGVVLGLMTLTQADSGLAQSSKGMPLGAIGQTNTLDLSLSDARQRALDSNPSYAAALQGIAVAEAGLTAARTYPFNPEFEFEAPGIVAPGELGEYEISVGQTVEWAGQGGLRRRAARFGVGVAEFEALDAARVLLAEVGDAFFSVLALEQRLGVARDIFELNEEMVGVTRIQVREGEISAMDANLAEIEAGRARAAVRASERLLASAAIELKRLTGIPPHQLVRLVENIVDEPAPTTLKADSLTALALVRRPDLAARRQAAERQRTQASVAAREAIPPINIRLFAEREDEIRLNPDGAFAGVRANAAPRFGISVGLPVPVFQRNQGRIAERRARAEQMMLEHSASEHQVAAQVADARQAYALAREEHLIFENEVLEPARANQRLLETAFRAGKVALPTLLLLRNQLLEAELSHWDAWLAERRALIALGAATATLSENLIQRGEQP